MYTDFAIFGLRSLGVEVNLPWGLEQRIERFAYESALAEALLSTVLYFVHDHFDTNTGDPDIPWMYDLSDYGTNFDDSAAEAVSFNRFLHMWGVGKV